MKDDGYEWRRKGTGAELISRPGAPHDRNSGQSAKLRKYRFYGLIWFGVAAAFLFIACGGASGTSGATEATPGSPESVVATPAPPSDASVAVNLPEDFPIEVYRGADVLGGEEAQFSSLFGSGSPVVLNFWAGLCPPCRAEMPDIQSVYDGYGDRVTFFGLDIGPFVALGSRDDALELLQDLGVTYPTGTTSNAKVVRKYRVFNMPTTVFLTPDGEVFKRWPGFITESKLRELTAELIEASAA